VSRVINRSPLLSDDTRKHVEGVIGNLGYVPNPRRARWRCGAIS
jgi:LacI family transcriptional regulator